MKDVFGTIQDRKKSYVISALVAKIDAGILLDFLDWEILADDQMTRWCVEKTSFERAGDKEKCVLDWGELYGIDTTPRYPWE